MSNPVDEKRPAERLGTYLAGVREARGMSVADLATVTHLSERNIELIEAGNWKAFAVDAYLRSYLNSVSSKLGVDSKRVMDWYNSENGMRHESGFMEFPQKLERPTTVLSFDEPKRKNIVIPAIVVIVGLAIVIAAHFARDVSKATTVVVESNSAKEAMVDDASMDPAEMPEGAEAVPVEPEKDPSSATKKVVADSTGRKNDLGLSQAQVDSAVKHSTVPASATIFISSTSTEKAAAAKVENAPVAKPAPVAAAPAPKPAAASAPAPAAAAPAPKPAPASAAGSSTQFDLLANGQKASWVGVKHHEDDPGFVRDANLVNPSDRLSYKTDDTIFVVIGEPLAISKMLLNGVETEIPPPRPGSHVIKFKVYAGRIVK